MEFEKIYTEGFDYTLTFNTNEDRLLRAAYREHLVGLVQKGNDDSIDDFEVYMSEYGQHTEASVPIDFTFSALSYLVEIVTKFHKNTDFAVRDIANLESIPPYKNGYVAERKKLGQKALDLIEDIRFRLEEDPAPADEPDEETPIDELQAEEEAVSEFLEQISEWPRLDSSGNEF